MNAERALRLGAEELIAGFGDLGIEEAMGALADVEAVASALAATGVMDVDAAAALVADTVDALAVRGASWVEPTAVDLDVRRLYDLATGAPRPRLRRVVPVASGTLTSVDLWDDRAEARVAGGPSLHLDDVPVGDHRLELRDEGGATVAIDLSRGRAASEGGTARRLGAAEYLERLEAHAAAAASRDPSIDTLNALRRRLVAVGEALGDPTIGRRFDERVSSLGPASPTPAFLDVVPVAIRAPFGWVLSVERWSDHWRAVVADAGTALWTAVDDDGAGYGGEVVEVGVVRFGPSLPEGWTRLILQRLGADGTAVDVEVRR